MVLFIDTNVLIDFLAKRDSFQSAIDKVFELILTGQAKGFVASHSITNIWYILRKDFSSEERRELLLPLMDFDFAHMCQAIINGTLKDFDFKWKPGFICAPVAVSGGYPEAYKKGMAITLPQQLPEGNKIFVAGATINRRNLLPGEGAKQLITNGGRVLAASAYGATFQEAWDAAYAMMGQVNFEGMFYRQDIGLPGAAESGNL